VSSVGPRVIAGHDVSLRRLTSEPEADPPLDELTTIEATRHLRLVDSNVGTIESGKKPRPVRSTCLQSIVAGSSASWGVCAND
jgi:hypothetical protein